MNNLTSQNAIRRIAGALQPSGSSASIPQSIFLKRGGCGGSAANIAAAVTAANNADCSLHQNDAVVVMEQAIRQAYPFGLRTPASDSIFMRKAFPRVQALTNPNSVTHRVQQSVELGPLDVLKNNVVLPDEADMPNAFSALATPSAGTGILGSLVPAPYLNGTVLQGRTPTIPIFGHLVRLQWAPGDLPTTVRIQDVVDDHAHIATVSPSGDECFETWLFVPAHRGAPVVRNRQLVFPWSGDSGITNGLRFQIFSGGVAANSLGGWQAETMPLWWSDKVVAAQTAEFNPTALKFERVL